jgi:integrase
MRSNRKFIGVFAPEFKMFLDEKRACGFKYIEEERQLRRLDEICVLCDRTHGLGKNTVLEFITPRPNWSQGTYESHVSITTQIARFLNLHGIPAYMPDTKLKLGIDRSFTPYIFSVKEIRRIFDIADNLFSGRSYIRSFDFYPVILRLLYSSGVRILEALHLMIKDVDLVNGTIFIKNAKNHKDRLLPLNTQVIPYLAYYAEKYHKTYRNDNFFFSPPHGGHYDKGTVYHQFRDILFKVGISHGGRENGGPRLHDVRHTFCVHSLRQFLINGIDHRAALPILSVYMGHTSIAATAKYLRLTAEAYPEISTKLEKEFGGLIPKWEASDDETN